MSRMKLTSAAVERMTAPAGGRVDVFDTVMPAFGVRVSGGNRSYFLMTRIGGKLTRLTIGKAKVGDGPGLSLAEARRKAGEWQEQAAAGLDPRQEQAAARQANLERAKNTFAAVAEGFWQKHALVKTRPGTQKETHRALFGKDVADWNNRPVASLTRRDVHELIDRIAARGSSGSAGRMLAALRPFFRWCVERDLIAASPAEGVSPPARIQHRERVLSEAEIANVWQASGRLGWPFGAIVRLLMLTGQRRDEVAAAEWSEFDLDDAAPVWTIPGTRAKNGETHLVPLSRQAVAILRSLPRQDGVNLAFTTTGKTAVSGFSKAKAKLDEAVAALRQERAETAVDGKVEVMEPWVLHDLRRTVATRLAEMGTPVPVIEKALNHRSGTFSGIVRVYNRSEYLPERRKALQDWADKVEAVAHSGL